MVDTDMYRSSVKPAVPVPLFKILTGVSLKEGILGADLQLSIALLS